jgi:hypothetical protein
MVTVIVYHEKKEIPLAYKKKERKKRQEKLTEEKS